MNTHRHIHIHLRTMVLYCGDCTAPPSPHRPSALQCFLVQHLYYRHRYQQLQHSSTIDCEYSKCHRALNSKCNSITAPVISDCSSNTNCFQLLLNSPTVFGQAERNTSYNSYTSSSLVFHSLSLGAGHTNGHTKKPVDSSFSSSSSHLSLHSLQYLCAARSATQCVFACTSQERPPKSVHSTHYFLPNQQHCYQCRTILTLPLIILILDDNNNNNHSKYSSSNNNWLSCIVQPQNSQQKERPAERRLKHTHTQSQTHSGKESAKKL